MIKLFSVILFFGTCLTSLSGQIQYRKTASGLYFNIVDNKPGQTAEIGQLVSLHMKLLDPSGQTIKNTFNDGKPLMFPIKLSVFEGDIYEAISLLSKGDSAIFQIKADSMYAKVFRKPIPKEITKSSYLDLQVRVYNVWDQKTYYDSLQAAKTNVVSDVEIKRRNLEQQEIEKYFKSKGYEMTQTTSGAYYSYFSYGNGEKQAQNGHTVVINFIGELLNGTEFETTFNEEGIPRPISFTLGKQEVILGWEEVLRGKKEGDKLFVIVPSHLAFGSQSKGNLIPAHSPLVFNIDVVGVR